MKEITAATVEGLRNGKTAAYDSIFLHFSKRVYIFINLIVDSPPDAEELTQDVFIKLWETRESVDPAKNIAPYIFVIARNMAISFLRKRRSQASLMKNLRETYSDAVTQDEDIEGHYMDMLVKMVVSTLPEHDRQIFKLSQTSKLSNEDIAQRLKISKRTVDNSLSKTKAQFRKIINMDS